MLTLFELFGSVFLFGVGTPLTHLFFNTTPLIIGLVLVEIPDVCSSCFQVKLTSVANKLKSKCVVSLKTMKTLP